MIQENSKDFISAGTTFKCTCTYNWSSHSKELFAKNDIGNTTENWEISINKQKDSNTNSTWMTIIQRDKDGQNLVQIDFDNCDREKLKEFINDLFTVYKHKFGPKDK